MNTNDRMAIIAIRKQRSELERLDEFSDDPGMNTPGHPFGSVLFRLKLALAVIYASRRQPSPVKARVRIRD